MSYTDAETAEANRAVRTNLLDHAVRMDGDALAHLDLFSFFYLPETDPTRADSHTEQTAPEAGESREDPHKTPAEEIHASKYRAGAFERWSNCPGRRYAGEPRVPYPHQVHDFRLSIDAPHLDPAELAHVQESVRRTVERQMAQGPRRGPELRIVRGERTIGWIPRPTGPQEGSCRLFDVGEFEPFPVAVDGQLRMADVAPGRQFVMLYQLWSQDGGWTLERVLDAADVSPDLIERIPGWRSSST